MKEESIDSAVHSQPDFGPPKSRRRFTTTVSKVNCSMRLDSVQRTTLDAFYRTGVNVVGEFTMDNQEGGTSTFRFRSPPSYSHLKGDGSKTQFYRAELQFWRLS